MSTNNGYAGPFESNSGATIAATALVKCVCGAFAPDASVAK